MAAEVDLYFRQCSLLVAASDLAITGATLANAWSTSLAAERAFALGWYGASTSVIKLSGDQGFATAVQAVRRTLDATARSMAKRIGAPTMATGLTLAIARLLAVRLRRTTTTLVQLEAFT